MLLLAACRAPAPDSSVETSHSAETAPTGDTDDTGETGDTGDTSGESGETDTGEPPKEVGPGFGLPSLAGLSIVYVHVDTLRADHLAAYGYGRQTLPRASVHPWRLVTGGYNDGPWTVPSTAAILSANPSERHGLGATVGSPEATRWELELPTIATHLRAQGWATAGFTGNPWVESYTDLLDDFDHHELHEKAVGAPNLTFLAGAAGTWLDTLPAEQPFLVWLQPMDLHQPFQISAEHQYAWGDTERAWSLSSENQGEQTAHILTALANSPEAATQDLVDTYDEALLDLDDGLLAVLDMLAARGRLSSTLVVVGADHGETLNDAGDGAYGHGLSAREELLRSPFLVLVPGQPAARADCPFQNPDVWPTLLDAAGLPPMADALGVSRRETCRDVVVGTFWITPKTMGRMAATDGQEKLEIVCGEGVRGFDLRVDPHETSPLDPKALAAYPTLQAALDELDARLEKYQGGVFCPMP